MNNVFGGGYCINHQYLRTDKKPKMALTKTSIAAMSDNLKKKIDSYADQRVVFLARNPLCKGKCCTECTGQSMEVHHMRGRGIYLLDEKTWLPVCRFCHIWIEEHPALAKLLNLSQSRLN